MTVDEFISQWQDGSDTVEVHTSGSTGTPKVMRVDKSRMRSSARVTCDFLDLHPGDTALLCMSVDYIAGKMMVVRALECGLRLVTVEPSSHPFAAPVWLDDMVQRLDFAAMVPMQVYASLQVPRERELLEQVRNIIIGGGPLDAALEQQLRGMDNAVWHSYGMTETLSHIALRRVSGPEASSWFTPLPGVTLTTGQDGCLVIDAPHLHDGRLVTRDIVEMEPGSQRFKVLGRIDNVIITGGIKVHIEQVEQSLATHIAFPFLITKCHDPQFGEAVVMLVEGGTDAVETARMACSQHLDRFSRPKHVFAVKHLPTTPNGKPARSIAQQIAATLVLKQPQQLF